MKKQDSHKHEPVKLLIFSASLRAESINTKLIKLADKTSNLRAVANSPAPDWSVERRLEYVEWAKSVVAGLRGASSRLEQQFDEAVERAVRALSLSPISSGQSMQSWQFHWRWNWGSAPAILASSLRFTS